MSDTENKKVLASENPEVQADETKEKGSGKKLTKDQRSTLKRLQELPKKTILIPEDSLNPDDAVVPISVNGVIYSVPRGVECEVPDVIFEIWRESYQKTAAANKRIKVQEDRKLQIG